MYKSLSEYKKNKEFLVCVDSDGCAMDTMDIKHFNCFGPCLVEEWNLFSHKDEILKRWNEINLYTMTRGINRFKGLALALSEIVEKYEKIEDIEALNYFVNHSDELSNDALKRAIEKNPDSVILKKALSWSMSVNRSINNLSEEDKIPFPMVKEALEYAHKYADIAIVSSANLDAVLEEWEKFSLLDYVDIVLAQNAGSKAFCISELLKKGYANNNVLMCGDAPGDLDASKKNDVFYYPILVKKEKESWSEFIETGLNNLLENKYEGTYQEEKTNAFLRNLSVK